MRNSITGYASEMRNKAKLPGAKSGKTEKQGQKKETSRKDSSSESGDGRKKDKKDKKGKQRETPRDSDENGFSWFRISQFCTSLNL